MNTDITMEIKGLLPPPSDIRTENETPNETAEGVKTFAAAEHAGVGGMIKKILICATAGLGILLMLMTCVGSALMLKSAGISGAVARFFPSTESYAFAEYIPKAEEPDSSGAETAEALPTGIQEPEETDDIYEFDYSAVPDGEMPIVPADLSTTFLTERPYLSNATKLSPDITALKVARYPLEPASKLAQPGEPLVLIIHTHGTEAYSDENSISYSDTVNTPRSTDITKNVVAVGAVMTERLLMRGVPTLHCTVMHDMESYKDSYSKSAETIAAYLEEYPSIKYVFDVHRDSIIRSNGEKLRPVSLYDNGTVAQVMSVVGTNEGGADFPDWEKNLNLALKLHTKLEEKYGQISRPINLRSAAFNERFSDASLLLEVGSCGNTLEEAKIAGVLLADTLADIIIKGNG